ncbi:NB-ARC domain-containing protein [Planktothrix sp.]|uniref:NB-ARC domain-containing protein n=1 Tax=Planktothrix sp. TaxID=3088171 RepID=UPI0038D50DCA
MNLKELLKVADKIVFAQTGQHLDDLEEAVLRGTLQHETYKQIAKDFDCSESNVRNTGSKLWQIFSEELGEDISKSNFRSAMERLQNSILFNFAQNVSGSLNICGESRHPPDIPDPISLQENLSNFKSFETPHQDLSEMPDFGAFYGRIYELETLKTWIIKEQCRLIAITGISGIGKTALGVQLVQQIKDEFEFVIWCNFDPSRTLAEFQMNLISFFSQSQQRDLSVSVPKALTLIKYLQQYRCLVVLDNIHNLFRSGDLAGKYQPQYEDYQTFFKQIKELSHQSCLLLMGWEQPRIVTEVKSKNSVIHSLQLTGLNLKAAQEILKEYGLTEIDKIETIIKRYQGNPLWLKSIADLLEELGESATKVLLNDPLFLPEEVKESLSQQCDRLSELEKQVMSLLVAENHPVSLVKLLENSKIISADFLNALQSLFRRSLIEKQENYYIILPIIKQYIASLNDL